MFKCVVLSAQVIKFQVSEVVRENMWGNCTKNISDIVHEEYWRDLSIWYLSRLIKMQFVLTAAP